jgi:methylmalonyl-CoA mutase
LRAIDVSSDPYDGGGASAVQELAYTVATGVEYLRHLTDAGLSVEAASRQIGFSYAVSGDFFTQIAKLRAARALWAKVVTAAGGEAGAAALRIHARTSRFTKTARDPWVNMLRVTAECTAAVLGGAQSVATLPFDCAVGPADELARRVARNTQVVLREESHLDAVADPAGGSWYVDERTEELARAAWGELQTLEAAGGIVKALGSGKLVDSIEEVANSRRVSLARRKTPIVGVSEFPNLGEAKVERDEVSQEAIKRMLRAALDGLDVGAHRDALLSLAREVNDPNRDAGALTDACLAATLSGADMYSVAAVLQHGQPDFHVEPIPQWRAASQWERLRDRSDAETERPTALLANLGAIPSHKARSTWTQNLLGAAGIEALSNDGFDDPRALGAAWKESSAALAVVCGSDKDYEAMLQPAVAALKQAGCPIVLVAGKPGDEAAALREAGVSDFVFVGADVLGVMTRVLDSVGVKR